MNKLNLVNCEDIDDDLLAQFRHAASRLAERLQTYRRHIADMQSEFDRLTAERDRFRVLSEACRPSGNDAPELVPTWTPPASLPDGIYSWKSTRLEKAEIDEDGRKSTWADWSPGESYKDWTVPPATGEWQVKSGRATYLGPNEVAQ